MAEQPVNPIVPIHRPEPGQPVQPVHTESNVARDIARQLREAVVIDNQVSRYVQFTEDEVKAMAEALESQAAPRSQAPKPEDKK